MDVLVKTCTNCHIEQSLTLFPSRSSAKDGKDSQCKRCKEIKRKALFKEPILGYFRARRKVIQRYGLTYFEFLEMRENQNGTCFLCPQSESLTVDHDHSCCSGKTSCGNCVRRLLCNRCNSVLGWIKDSETWLIKAYNYLEEFNV